MKGWSAPGNCLLAGEYRIMERDGLGVGMATGGRAFLRLELQKFHMPHKGISIWDSKNRDTSSELLLSVYKALKEPDSPAGDAIVDTSVFFDKNGNKKGYGSSAVAALLFSRFLLHESHPKSISPLVEKALMAHRQFQGNRGSGYDIYTSAHGGVGLFKNGDSPSWTPISWPNSIKGVFIPGSSSVDSKKAIERYSHWRSEKNDVFMRRGDEFIMRFIHLISLSPLSDDVFTSFAELGFLGEELGSLIGVPAKARLPKSLGKDILKGTRKGAAVKCLGAGDELSLLLYREDALSQGELRALKPFETLYVEMAGLREESGV